MKRFIIPLAVSLCLLVAISQPTAVLAKDSWVSVRTKNFFLIGNGGEKDIKRVALKLEQFREVFTMLFPAIKFNTPVPTTVVVFKSHSSYNPFKPGPSVAGHFQSGPDVNYIALTTEAGAQDAYSIIFHEYTHLLVNNTFDNAPVWFNEGLAEYYSSFSISDDQKIVLGNPISNHVFLLRESKMLPLRTLFEVDHKSPHYNEAQKKGIFYAQSWALMHYLIIGKEGRVEQLGKFLDRLKANVPLEQAFQQAFEVTFDVMEKDLRNYIKNDRYNIIRASLKTKVELDTNVQSVPLTEAEGQAYLGDLLLHSSRKESYSYFEKALKLEPNLAMAHASMGMAYFREGKVKEAHASLERAVSGNSQNYLAHYYYALTLSRASEDAPVAVQFSPELAAKIREHLQKSISLRPDYPESYHLLAFVALVTGNQMDEAIVAMKRILTESPGRHDFTFTLAQLYMRKGDYKLAGQTLEKVVKSNADESMRKAAEFNIQQIQKFEQATAQYEESKRKALAAGGAEPVIVTVDQTVDAPTDPSQYLREALRTPASGETQLQVSLVKIECEPKGIVFVVQTPTGLLRLRTTSFDDIELTTYDPKVNGQITCGPMKTNSVVVVCYLPNADKKLKVDGILKSIEFVPSDFKLKPTQ
jgi:tetratricopeptide (TPR) repeat protein